METPKKQFTKDEISGHFSESNRVKVVFAKKDGSLRTMICTTDILTIPEEHRPKVKETSDSQAKPKPAHLFPVFDLEANGWRSFVVDNVRSVEPLKSD